METILDWLAAQGDFAPVLVFILLVLTGLSVPISEDLLLVGSGVLAGTVLPDKTLHLFFAVFLGCYASDGIAYWIGRAGGQSLQKLPWFRHVLHAKRLATLKGFFDRYGAWTLFFGRFIPFGVRNGIFMSAGLGKMPFSKFLVSDGISCLLFSALIFFLAYALGSKYEMLLHSLHMTGKVLLAISLTSVLIGVGYIIRQKRMATTT
jgi:membrane protein DedA with SNARE-associated domain